MPEQEVGRFACTKCGRRIVAVGPRTKGFKGLGAFMGPCPWECGAWISRGFRFVRPGQVRTFRAQEWDERPLSQGLA